MTKKAHPWRQIPPVEDIELKLPAGVRSAARPLRVLEFFDEIRRPARAREIWERLAFPQSTTSLLLKGMVALGYLDYDPADRSFQPSLRVTMLGQWRDGDRGHVAALVKVAGRLFERTGLSASLACRQGIFIRYLHIVQSERAGQPHASLNARRYAIWSTSGMAMLAAASEKDVQDLIRVTLAERAPGIRKIRADRIPAMLASARQQGFFAETGLVTPNVRSISVRVPAAITGSGAPLAVTLAGHRRTLGRPDKELARLMRSELAALRR